MAAVEINLTNLSQTGPRKEGDRPFNNLQSGGYTVFQKVQLKQCSSLADKMSVMNHVNKLKPFIPGLAGYG